MRLNLGSGSKPLEGYINIDIQPCHNPDIVGDVCDLALFETNSVEEVRLDAVYEHIYRLRRLEALEEWHRVLVFGGKLIINWIPDFEALLDAYGGIGPNKDFPIFDITMARRMLYGKGTNEPSLHKDCFSLQKVEDELELAGFHHVEVWKEVYPGDHQDAFLNLCARAYK